MSDEHRTGIHPSPARRFLDDETGSMTIEFLLWLPVFIFVLGAVVDASILFQAQADMQAVARDSARRMAMDEMDAYAAQSYALDSLAEVSTYTFAAAAQETGSGDHTFSVMTISVPVSEVSVFSFFAELLSTDFTARAAMRNRVFPT